MLIENQFDIGQEVYLKTDKDQLVRLVTSIQIRTGSLLYELSCGSSSSWHYEFEITVQANVLLTSTN
jgi:hypothetical protein